MLVQGQIIKQISNLYTVRVADKLYDCRPRGIFRQQGLSPIVGDYVKINPEDKIIETIIERRNILKRPVIANVDMAIIITSTKSPNLDLNLLDKLISVITFNNIEPVICFTKIDLLTNQELENINHIKKYYEQIGLKVFKNTEIDAIKKYLNNKTAVLAGQTGAGKSSLLNNLNQELNIATSEISIALGRGKHTTRHVELYEIAAGYIADTPGFSCLDLKNMTREQLRDTFVEFTNYECKFHDCMHHKETGCQVKEAVQNNLILQSRYNNYIQFMEAISK